jgi:hypothetical protein
VGPLPSDLQGLAARVQVALVTAAGVALVAAGLLVYGATGAAPLATPAPTPGDPTPTGTETPRPVLTIAPGTPAPTSEPTGTASRFVIPAMRIDMAVVEAPPGFPYCNVAQYVKEFSQPGRPGTTVIGAHARTGMFLPLLETSRVRDGAAMLGMLVQVYTSDARLYLYEIEEVRRHQLDYAITALPEGVEQQLVITTSEGSGAVREKLMIRARYLYSTAADPQRSNPTPRIVVCQ